MPQNQCPGRKGRFKDLATLLIGPWTAIVAVHPRIFNNSLVATYPPSPLCHHISRSPPQSDHSEWREYIHLSVHPKVTAPWFSIFSMQIVTKLHIYVVGYNRGRIPISFPRSVTAYIYQIVRIQKPLDLKMWNTDLPGKYCKNMSVDKIFYLAVVLSCLSQRFTNFFWLSNNKMATYWGIWSQP